MRSFVVDGNFTADHIKQTRPNDDVWLTNGEGMMTEKTSYNAHMKAAKDIPDVSFVVMPIGNYCFDRLEPVRPILVPHWKATFGPSWIQKQVLESKMSQA